MNKVIYNSCYGGYVYSKAVYDWMKKKYGISRTDVIRLPRHDRRLVECIETLGDDASGEYSCLKIKEIKGDVYFIDEYDGMETVMTPDDMKDCWIKIDDEK